MEEIKIRFAVPEDAEKLLAIYAPYVRETAITFEYDVPSAEEFEERIRGTLARYPYLVAESGGEILGYAYAGVFKARAAYDRSVEVSVYVKRGARRNGIGRRLYEALEEELKSRGILNLYACIAYTEHDDEYLTADSVRFHEHMGYVLAGRFHRCGFKFERWYDMVWMEKLF